MRHKRLKLYFSACLLTLFTQAGLAAPMGIIFVENKKPSRVVYVAEFLNIYNRGAPDVLASGQKKIAEMRVVAVYENKKSPESVDMTTEFSCHKNEYRITMAHAMIRDGSEKFPTQDWKPFADAHSAWPMAAAKIACESEVVAEAAKKTSGKDFSALEKLGILYIDDLDRLQVVDTVWKTILVDGTRPAYVNKKLTDAEVAIYNKKIDAGLADLKKQTEAGLAMGNAELKKMKSEQEFKKEIAKNSKKHTDLFGKESRQFKQLNWLLGQKELDIIRMAGNPVNSFEADGARYLTYYNEYVIDGLGYTRNSNGDYLSTGTNVTCELQIEMRQGGASNEFRAVDYRAFASNGGCRDFSWFNKAAR